jgi:hypothetical protein
MRLCVTNIVAGSPREHEITKQNHANYAARIGAEYVAVRLPAPDVSDRSKACGWKYTAADVAANYDLTLYLDCDCVITRLCPSFHTAVPAGHWGVIDELCVITGGARASVETVQARNWVAQPWTINAGVMIMPSDAKRVYKPQSLEEHWLNDQAALSASLYNDEAKYRLIDRRWNWSFMHPYFLTGLPTAYIIHRAGQPIFTPLGGVEQQYRGLERDIQLYA